MSLICNSVAIFVQRYDKYMYNSAPCDIVYASDFMCGRYMCIHLPFMPIKYLAYIACMPKLVGIFVSCTYLAITCEVEITISCF